MVGTLRPEICFVIYVITTYCVASRQPLSCLSAGFRQFAILHSEMNRAVETYMNMYNSRLTQQTFDCTYMNMQRLKDACRFTIILFAFAHRKYASENSCEIRFSFQIGDAISRRSLIGRLRNSCKPRFRDYRVKLTKPVLESELWSFFFRCVLTVLFVHFLHLYRDSFVRKFTSVWQTMRPCWKALDFPTAVQCLHLYMLMVDKNVPAVCMHCSLCTFDLLRGVCADVHHVGSGTTPCGKPRSTTRCTEGTFQPGCTDVWKSKFVSSFYFPALLYLVWEMCLGNWTITL